MSLNALHSVSFCQAAVVPMLCKSAASGSIPDRPYILWLKSLPSTSDGIGKFIRDRIVGMISGVFRQISVVGFVKFSSDQLNRNGTWQDSS